MAGSFYIMAREILPLSMRIDIALKLRKKSIN